jgi:hypothetical protein
VPHDQSVTFDRVTTLDDLLGGELCRTPTGEAQIVHHCPEAQTAIQKGISTALKNIPFNRGELRREIHDAVIEALVRYLGSPTISKTKFLRSPNRLGWLYLFTVKTAKGWIRERMRERDGDARVQTALRQHLLPAETLTEHLERERMTAEKLSSHFDPFQFAGKQRPEHLDAESREPIEHFSSDLADAERLAVVRRVLETLSEDDREFFEDYIDSKYERGRKHSPAERKLFARLRQRVRCAVNGKEAA